MRTIFQKQYLTEYFILISNRNMKEFFKKNPFAKWLLYIIWGIFGLCILLLIIWGGPNATIEHTTSNWDRMARCAREAKKQIFTDSWKVEWDNEKNKNNWNNWNNWIYTYNWTIEYVNAYNAPMKAKVFCQVKWEEVTVLLH